MRAEQPHRLPRRGAHRRQAEPLGEAVEDALRRLARMDDARRQMPSAQAEAETRSASTSPRDATSRRRRACPRSGGRRWRHPARAAAPRPAPSAPGPPWSRANSRAGSPRCRRARRTRRGSPRPAVVARASMRASACSPREAPASSAAGKLLVRRRVGRGEAGRLVPAREDGALIAGLPVATSNCSSLSDVRAALPAAIGSATRS